MTWADERIEGCWWQDVLPFAENIPWPENIVFPVTRSGNFDYNEVACMREQVWAEREGLA
jgi:hypothetical protein